MKYYTRKFDDGTAYHEIITFGYFVDRLSQLPSTGVPTKRCRLLRYQYINARQMKESKDFYFQRAGENRSTIWWGSRALHRAGRH